MAARVVLAVLAAGTMAAGSMNCFAGVVSKNATTPSTSEESSTEEASSEESSAGTIDTDSYYFGKINVPYADFYYGEIKKVLPEALEDGAAGQYDAEDKVTAAGFREEGIYDAVSSATSTKSQRFAGSYFEQKDEGTDILGVSGVNVAISKALYDDVKAAIEANTECSNPLINFVSALTEVSEEVPAEYKVINSDGTLSQTIGTTKEAENVEVSFATVSVWGNYQIDFDGLEIESDDIQGGLIETSDGSIYGLEHLDNLWLRANEIAFAAEEMTEPHGNTPSWQRFADIQGKTITKVTYLLADQDDITITTDLYCKELLGADYSITGDETTTYSKDGTKINVTINQPEDADYKLAKIESDNGDLTEDQYTIDGNVVTLAADQKAGDYYLIFSDEKYADQEVDTFVESGLPEGSVTIEDNKIVVAENDGNMTGADYATQVTAVYVNGEQVKARHVGYIVVNEDGSINMDAEIEGENGNVKVFDGSDSYELTLEANGYPSVTGTVTATAK